jgi:hypothetical protein
MTDQLKSESELQTYISGIQVVKLICVGSINDLKEVMIIWKLMKIIISNLMISLVHG